MSMGLAGFFGVEEWRSMFVASIVLFFLTLSYLLSRVVLWIGLVVFGLAMLWTGYKVFFVKSRRLFDADDFKGFFKR